MFQMTISTPMLVLIVVMGIIITLRRCAPSKMKAWGFVISTNVLTVDENLPNFFSACKLSDSQWFVKESRYFRQTYKFSFANKTVVDRLDKERNVPKKPMQGIPWYNILSNPIYCRDFSYISVDMPDRNDYIVDDDDDEDNDMEQSDMVSILINLPYMNK